MSHDETTCLCCQEWIALESIKLKHIARGPVWLTRSEIKATPVASIVAQVPFHVSIGCGCFTIRMHEPVDTAALRQALGPAWIVRQTKSYAQSRTKAVPGYDVLVCKREPLTERDKELAMREYEKSL